MSGVPLLLVSVGVLIFLCGISLSMESGGVCDTSVAGGSHCIPDAQTEHANKYEQSPTDDSKGDRRSQYLEKDNSELGPDNNLILEQNKKESASLDIDSHSNNLNEDEHLEQTSLLHGEESDSDQRTDKQASDSTDTEHTSENDNVFHISPSHSQDIHSDNEYDPESDNPQLQAVFPRLEVIGGKQKSTDDVVGTEKQSAEEDPEPPSTKRRYFPLLYTFRTLFNSLLSELGGSQDGSFNSSDSSTGNFTIAEDVNKDSNLTINGTNASKKTRFQCATKNITHNTTGEVKIVNSTELLEMLNFSKNQKVSTCVLVMFYAPWCHFCARTAPHYNALARAFPQLDVLAVDTSHFSYLNARFGTVAVPNVMLFHARSAVRFNHTTRVFDSFIHFVRNNTGLEPNKLVKLEPLDFVGPLPSTVRRGRDWLLWLAWAFVIMCSTFGFVRSRYGQGFITRLRVLWQEHQHIE